MKVAIHQPNFIPWLGYFNKIKNCDVFVFLDDVKYSDDSVINRVKIKTPRGASWLTLPIQRKTANYICNVEYVESRVCKILDTVHHNYSRASYYNDIYLKIMEILSDRNRSRYLSDINSNIIVSLCRSLDIGKRFLFSHEMNLDPFMNATDRLIKITEIVGGDTYYSGMGSSPYLESNKFTNIKLEYQKYEHPIYRQMWDRYFIHGLSIFDAIANEGIDKVKEMI